MACEVPAFHSACLTPGPPRHRPTQHRPLPKEPTVLAEALLTAAHLGPGWGGPGRGREGGLCLIVFRHQLRRLESQTAERGPFSPLEQGQTPGFFPGKVHLGVLIASSLSPLPLDARHLVSHQLSTGPELTQQRQAGGSITTPSTPQGTVRLRAQPRGLTHMKIPPTLLPLYKEKSRNNLARVLVQQTKVEEAVGWNSGVLDSSLNTARASLFLTPAIISHFPPRSLFCLVIKQEDQVILSSTNIL